MLTILSERKLTLEAAELFAFHASVHIDPYSTFFPFRLEFALAGLRAFKWILSQRNAELTSMGFIVETSSLAVLLGICAVDSTTFYIEVLKLSDSIEARRNSCSTCLQHSSKNSSKSYDPNLQSDESFSYKNSNSCFLSKMTFWWMTPLLWKGFFKPLELSDLGNLEESDTSRYHYDQFLFIYQSFKVSEQSPSFIF